MAGAVLRHFRDFIAQAPDEVCGGCALISAPPEEFVPEPVRGQPMLGMVLCYAGPLDDAEEGLKPLREFEETDPHAHMDHEKTTPVIAKHDFADGDDVPGSFFAMGPGIKHDMRLMGFEASVYDIAPTILHIYGIAQPPQMHGRVLTEIFEGNNGNVAEK